jgi:predicted DNA-binding transcriptional regulator AlpA
MTVKTSNQPSKAGFLRLWHIIGDSKTNPPIPAVIPVSRTTWNNGVKSGRYPKPVKLGERMVAWRSEDIYELINRLGKAA